MMNVEDLLGKQFELGARGPNTFDCWGLCVEYANRAGIELPQEYTPAEMAALAVKFETMKDEDFTKLEGPKPGSVVVFRMPPPIIWHTGIVLECGFRFIHIMAKRSVTTERLDSPLWKRRIEGYYEYSTCKD